MTIPTYILSDQNGSNAFALNSTFFIADHSASYQWGMQPIPRAHGGHAIDTPYLTSKALSFRGSVGAGAAGGSLPQEALSPFSYTGSGVSGDIQFVASSKTINALGSALSFSQLQIGQSIVITGSSSNNKTVTVKSVVLTATGVIVTVNETLTNENSSVATLTASMFPVIDVVYLSQLHRMAAFFLQNPHAILDYRNGYVQYVLVESIKWKQNEGWGTDRDVEIGLLCEDPFAYEIALQTATIGGTLSTVLSVPIYGNAPTRNYRLKLRSNDVSKTVVVQHNTTGTTFTVALPAATFPYPVVLQGWQRLLYENVITNTVWANWTAGGVFPLLQSQTMNAFSVFDTSNAIQQLTDLGGTAGAGGGANVQMELTAHSAIWLADSMPAPGNLPPGAYDISQYDIGAYG